MKIIVHYPETKENVQELKKKVAQVHADFVTRYISNLACNSEEKIKLTDKIKDVLLSRSAIIMQEKMKVEFDLLRRQTQELKKKINKNYSEVIVLKDVIFQVYANSNVKSFEFMWCLVNHYVKYLEAMLRLGNKTYSYITTSSNGNWKKCSDLMKRLLDDDRVTNTKRAEPNAYATSSFSENESEHEQGETFKFKSNQSPPIMIPRFLQLILRLKNTLAEILTLI